MLKAEDMDVSIECFLHNDKNDPYHQHSLVYSYLFRENYNVIASAQNNLSIRECIKSIDFWKRVLDILNKHMLIVPQQFVSDIEKKIIMVNNLLNILLLDDDS